MTDGRKIVRSNGQCINQLIREERMRLDDIEWETGVRPSEGALLLSGVLVQIIHKGV